VPANAATAVAAACCPRPPRRRTEPRRRTDRPGPGPATAGRPPTASAARPTPCREPSRRATMEASAPQTNRH